MGVPRRTMDDPYLDPYLDPYPRKGMWVKAKGVWVVYGASRYPINVHTAIHDVLQQRSCTDSSVIKDPISDAGGPRFESHAGRVTGKPTPKPLEG